ncbi:Homoserine dehydrogenase [uncultured archaeon]|nr:Homoserine dehydrogenase [uncultured archaeon]
MKQYRILIVGFGIIGKGLLKTLEQKQAYIRKRHGVDLRVSGVCEINGCLLPKGDVDLSTVLSKPLAEQEGWRQGLKTLDAIKESTADAVVELTPGNIQTGQPGLNHILAALESGKDVATSNKAPFATNYKRIMDAQEKTGKTVLFEATVGGAVPLLNLYRETLKADSIESIYGILNGTTNFILTKMTDDGVPFDAALNEAKELGIAEPDPTYYIQGIDTAAKVVILANALMGQNITFSDVKVTGIADITYETVSLASKHGYAIKLIGDVGAREVSPRLVPKHHPLNVSGTLNAIQLNTDIARDVTVIGRGAGPRETSSAILSDVITLAGRK